MAGCAVLLLVAAHITGWQRSFTNFNVPTLVAVAAFGAGGRNQIVGT
jgi:hypothetical protein